MRKKTIDSLVTDLIITDLQPLSIVEDSGFIALLQFLDPKYRLPSRKLLKNWINEKYKEAKNKIQLELDNINKVYITTDIWTSINTDSFLTVTCHFINEEFKLRTYTLETIKFEGNHTSSAICYNLQNVFHNWKLENKVISVVTDNAANMKSAIKQIEPITTNILCLEHILRQRLIHYTEYYLNDIENNNIYMIATLLDPRFKTLAFSNNDCITRASNMLLEEANKYISNDTVSTSTNDSMQNINNSQSHVNDEHISLWSSFDTEIIVTNNNMSNSTVTATEVRNYLEIQYVHRRSNPLLFWSANKIQYPILSKCARDYLCIMATSVPSERVFSKAGNIINKKRNRLKPNIVNQILFLNSCKY